MENLFSHTELVDLVTGGIGTLSGYFTRSQHNRHEISKFQLEALSNSRKNNLRDQEKARSYTSKAMSGMRFIIIGVIGVILLSLFLLPGLLHWKVNIESIHSTGIISSLFKGHENIQWHTFKGLVIPQQFWQLCFYIGGFLFGGRG